MDLKQFFTTIYGDTKGHVVIVLPNFSGKPTNDYWFTTDQIDQMVEFVEQHKTGDVWFSPIVFDSERRTKDTAFTTNVLGADADSCDPTNFRTSPTITVQSSPGSYQVYWAVGATDPHEAAKINRRIAQVHKDQGCDTAFVNAAKLMRVPGTSNSKHPGAIVIIADVDFDHKYSVKKFNTLYPESEIPDAIDYTKSQMPADLPEWIDKNRSSLISGMPNSITLKELMFGKFREDKRSDVRFKLLCELYRMGLDDYAVMALAWGAPSNKFRTDSNERRGYLGLWDEAMKAKAYVENEWENDPIDSSGNGFVPRDDGSARVRTSFITDDEQELIRNTVNFIDEWIEWAGTKTDSPKVYHRAGAMILLSAVYSEFGHATPKYAKDGLKLNLWIMPLGKSTKDRKTTARSYVNAAFRRLKTEDYNYSIGDDVTPSGISLALHERAHKSTVFDRDEVQGLFKELLSQSYMTGGTEVFTKLYDGWSGGRVRASGDKKIQESVPVSFIMYVMGILTETAEVLTVSNFKSGFLTRFLFVIGERPADWTQEPSEQSDEDDDGSDPIFDSLINHLATTRSWWELLYEEGKTVPIRAEADAWERFQKFEMEVIEKAAQSRYADIIETTSDRMTKSTLKLAALLAMDTRSRTIKLEHMVQAIAYAGEWFDNSIIVASMVSESEWERDVDSLEQFIASKGGSCSFATAYRQFNHKKPRDFEEMLQALESRGVLRREAAGARWTLILDYSDD